jgi:2-C-methyl-D-erythritol 4-phosphate cytidylyltransferase
MRFVVVIPAAGSGTRMGAPIPKTLLEISAGDGGVTVTKTILRWSVERFAKHRECSEIVVCVPGDWLERFTQELSGIRAVSVIVGGATRQDSVCLGVEYLAKERGVLLDSPVLVHDAARCFLSDAVMESVLEGIAQHGAVTAAVKVSDSVCRAGADGSVSEYVDRTGLYAVQTPQGFILKDLLRAHRNAKDEKVTALDDAGLVARLRPVKIVAGDRANIKVTERGDLEGVLVEK